MKTESNSVTVRQTRENLKQAFWLLAAKKRFDKISVREVVHQAGYNRTTFYNYYEDILDLLDEIENDILDKIDLCFSKVFENGDLEELIEKAFNSFFELEEYLRTLLGESGDTHFEAKLKRRFKVTMRRFIKKSNAFSAASEYKLEFYSSGLINVIKMWLFGETPIDVKSFSAVILGSINL